MFGLGHTELLLFVLVLVLLFGSSQVPKLARSIGQSIHEFRKGVNSDE